MTETAPASVTRPDIESAWLALNSLPAGPLYEQLRLDAMRRVTALRELDKKWLELMERLDNPGHCNDLDDVNGYDEADFGPANRDTSQTQDLTTQSSQENAVKTRSAINNTVSSMMDSFAHAAMAMLGRVAKDISDGASAVASQFSAVASDLTQRASNFVETVKPVIDDFIHNSSQATLRVVKNFWGEKLQPMLPKFSPDDQTPSAALPV